MSKLARETVVKDPSEVILVDFIFPDADFGTGVNFTGTPTIVEVGTADLTLDNKAINARRLQVRISGGVDETQYQIKGTCSDDGSPAQTHVAIGRLLVEDAG